MRIIETSPGSHAARDVLVDGLSVVHVLFYRYFLPLFLSGLPPAVLIRSCDAGL